MKRALALLLVLAACTTPQRQGDVRVTARAVPFSAADPAADRAGELRYLGGLWITSSDRRFGGLSGLRILENGQALAVSDQGDWVAFRIVERNGRPVAIDRVHIAEMRGIDSRTPDEKAGADSESVELMADGTAVVTFEGDHRVASWRGFSPTKLDAPATMVARPPAMRGWPRNGGAEAFAEIGPETDVMLQEDGDHDGLLTNGSTLLPFRYRPPQGFSPTDAAGLGDGRALVLHRRFTQADGVSAVIGIADFGAVRPGGSVAPRVIARLAPPFSVDNMEGIAVVTTGNRRIVWLVSDDNFSRTQRTLLLKFEWAPQ
jgi:hypothetical protein